MSCWIWLITKLFDHKSHIIILNFKFINLLRVELRKMGIFEIETWFNRILISSIQFSQWWGELFFCVEKKRLKNSGKNWVKSSIGENILIFYLFVVETFKNEKSIKKTKLNFKIRYQVMWRELKEKKKHNSCWGYEVWTGALNEYNINISETYLVTWRALWDPK